MEQITSKESAMKKWPRLLVPNNPYGIYLNRDVAEEIGFHESIVFLQLAFLVGTSRTEERDGNLWTYQTLDNLQEMFPWWGRSTIDRIIKSLATGNENKGYGPLIKVGNYNRLSFDRTRWFALNWDEVRKLSSVHVDDASVEECKKKRARKSRVAKSEEVQ